MHHVTEVPLMKLRLYQVATVEDLLKGAPIWSEALLFFPTRSWAVLLTIFCIIFIVCRVVLNCFMFSFMKGYK